MKFRFTCVFLCALLACSIAYADTEIGAGKPAASERSAADRQPGTIGGVLMQARGGPSSSGGFLAQVMGTDKGASDCCTPNGGLGCDDSNCQALICGADAFCCDVAWDGICADAAIAQCAVCDGEPLPPPANDDCADAINIPLSAGQTTSVSGDTSAANPDGGVAPDCLGVTPEVGVWYTVTGTGNTITLSTCPDEGLGLGTARYDTAISVYCEGCGDLTCVSANDDVNCPSQEFASTTSFCSAPGEEYHILMHGFSTDTGTFTMQVSDNNTSCAGPICGMAAEADLSVTKDAVNAPSDPQVNDVFDYDLIVSNAGPNDATNAVVTDSLPSALGFVGSDCGIVEGPPGELTWNVGTLAVGASAVCTLTVVIVHFSDLIINVAETESDVADNNPDDNSDESVESGAKPIIPTLAPWGLLLLALGLAAVGVRRLRRNA